MAVGKTYAGYLVIADRLKDDAVEAVRKLKKMGIKTVMLTGDDTSVARSVAEKLKIDEYYAELLPEDKVKHIETLLDGKITLIRLLKIEVTIILQNNSQMLVILN